MKILLRKRNENEKDYRNEIDNPVTAESLLAILYLFHTEHLIT